MFQQLEALSKLSNSRDQQRHGQSEKFLLEGLNLIDQANAEGFSRPLRLQEAASHLTEAIKHKRTDTRPYLGLAYIFLLLEDHNMAQKYVRQALQLEPTNQLAKAFQARIAEDFQRVSQRRQELRSTTQLSRSKAPLAPVARLQSSADELDADALYDEAEAKIRQLLRDLMLAGLPNPAADSKGILALQQRYENYQQLHQGILKQLAIVDEELDTSSLQRLLKPVDAHQQRCRAIIAFSQELKGLKDSILQETEQVEAIIEEARSTEDPADIEVLEENLEALLDNADGYAQDIERLQTQNFPLAGIEDLYEKLQERLESYQDALEETHSRLKP